MTISLVAIHRLQTIYANIYLGDYSGGLLRQYTVFHSISCLMGRTQGQLMESHCHHEFLSTIRMNKEQMS